MKHRTALCQFLRCSWCRNPGRVSTGERMKSQQSLTIQKLIMMPNSMANCCIPMSKPRSSGGAHSATYIGTIMESDPTPIPT
jgi:hypothetical protein